MIYGKSVTLMVRSTFTLGQPLAGSRDAESSLLWFSRAGPEGSPLSGSGASEMMGGDLQSPANPRQS
jgi:hypothetical protein